MANTPLLSPEDRALYTQETHFFNFSHPDLAAFVKEHMPKEGASEQEIVEALYTAVRDHWRYNAYLIHLSEEEWRAGSMMQKKDAHCLDKAAILISCLRAAGIPARLRLAKVKNHIAVERLVEFLGNDVLVPHGYVEAWLDGKWLELTPAFNKELCQVLKVPVMEFDPVNGTKFQAYNLENDQFMEYLEEYGHYDELPIDFILKVFYETYPNVRPFVDQYKGQNKTLNVLELVKG